MSRFIPAALSVLVLFGSQTAHGFAGEGDIQTIGFQQSASPGCLNLSLTQDLKLGCCSDGCTNENCDGCAFNVPVQTSTGCSRSYAGFEYSHLKAYADNINGMDFEPAFRVFAGHENAEGLGIRGTYWRYDSPVSLPFILLTNLQAQTADVDVTHRATFAGWDLLTFGGVRWAEFEFLYPGQRTTVSGFGPTIGLEVRKNVTDRLNLIAAGRGGLTFGKLDQQFGFVDFDVDDTFETFDLQVGAEYQHPVGQNAFFAKALFEAKRIGEVSFVGPTFGVGFSR